MNDTIKQALLWVLGSLGSLGVLLGGMGYLVSKWKGGTKEEEAESKDLISSNDQIKEFYKNQNEDLKKIISEQNGKIETLTREVGEVRGQLTAQSKQAAEYLAILQGKDDGTKKFMELMVQAVKDQAENQKEMIRVLGEIHAMAQAEHDRDFKIESVVTKQ